MNNQGYNNAVNTRFISRVCHNLVDCVERRLNGWDELVTAIAGHMGITTM